MAYADPLDPASPISTDPVGEGDDRIRELKRAIIARLETIFTDIDADPLQFATGIFNPDTMFGAGTIVGSKLVDGSVTAAKLAALPGVADAAITTSKLADASVTTAKLVDGAVSADKIGAGVIRRSKFHANLAQDLTYWQQFTLTLGSVIIAPNGVYSTAWPITTNDQYGISIAAIVQPAFVFADGAAGSHPTDYFNIHASAVQASGNEYLIIRMKNFSTLAQDITGQTFYVHLLQRLSTGPAEAP